MTAVCWILVLTVISYSWAISWLLRNFFFLCRPRGVRFSCWKGGSLNGLWLSGRWCLSFHNSHSTVVHGNYTKHPCLSYLHACTCWHACMTLCFFHKESQLPSDEYVEAMEEMKGARWQTQKSLCLSLMEATRPNRRLWIVEDKPSTQVVLQAFPLLREVAVVSVP